MSVFSYHDRTKHRLEQYAAGPETLDWTQQPDPFRKFPGAPRILLPLVANKLVTPFSEVYGKAPIQPISIESIGMLLQLSMALSAWKEYGPDRWALRCTPSSGNLHPTECYVLSLNIPGIESGLYHYSSLDHALEKRCSVRRDGESKLHVGLSSIHWREAWKYGERAFRYCQLDIGHALGALRYAAGVLGWRLDMLDSGNLEMAKLLGLDRASDFAGAEPEEADLILEASFGSGQDRKFSFPDLEMIDWAGRANLLDPHPLYHWPVIDEVAMATRKTTDFPVLQKTASHADCPHAKDVNAARLILGRRSAQHFDASFVMKQDDFFLMLDRLLDRKSAPWDIWNFGPRVHPVFFAHRIEGMAPGLYAMPRSDAAQAALREALRSDFLWEKVGPDLLPLYLLARGDFRTVAKTISCNQAIASSSCFSLGMLAEFEETITHDPWRYRQLHWEAGLIGHVLYLEAEASGLRGTGIGCFFDDAFHELLGLSDKAFQSLYHFTVGMPLLDARISTLPPYPERDPQKDQ